MNNYQRNGKIQSRQSTAPAPAPVGGPDEGSNEEGAYRVDGFQQVLEMLRIADDDFRASLLRRLERAEPMLARQLKVKLRQMGII